MREDVYCFLKAHFRESDGKILDLGCGPGHYCGRFQSDGYDALGIDLDEEMISAARKKYPKARFSCMNMIGIDTLKEKFHTIYSIGNVLAHVSLYELHSLLPEIRKLLYPHGYWIFQVVNWNSILTRQQYIFPVKSLAGGKITFHREYANISEKHVLFRSFMKSGDAFVFDEQTTLYPLRSGEYLKLHQKAGFQPVGMYADFKKSRYKKEADSGAVFVFSRDHSGVP
ncbi:class I SAM-dependent methyltransferase [Prosthecochloris sp. SCSIO W1101]|uniref:class I SAM-dependent methyltransferase n=1 Tax=Prosthecochloris sp. SCSIO W1101 TaxID=2992242 RepID=UPI00223DF6D8|nr:class I SAM-dependent methyltransferase [Prosthecochloris sp. SCSIO W1101]UZJ42703.1 class I SAM-dependent methyltransferase [Prosthecochloris sp. SCSIO W1101]